MWTKSLLLVLLLQCFAERVITVDLVTPVADCALGEQITLRVPADPFTGFLWFFRPPEGRKVTLLNGLTGTFHKDTSGRSGYQDFRVECPLLPQEGSRVRVKLEKRALWREEAAQVLTVQVLLPTRQV